MHATRSVVRREALRIPPVLGIDSPRPFEIGLRLGRIGGLFEKCTAGVKGRIVGQVPGGSEFFPGVVLAPQPPFDQAEIVLRFPIPAQRLIRPLEDRDGLLAEREHQIGRERGRRLQHFPALARRFVAQ